MVKIVHIVVFLFCLLKCSYSTKLPKLNNFKYSYIKTGSGKKRIGTNPVYLLLSADELVNDNKNKNNLDNNTENNKNENKNNNQEENKDNKNKINSKNKKENKKATSIDLIAPKDVNVVENNNVDEVVNNLKRRIFTDEPTLIKFKTQVYLNEKNTNPENDVTSSILKMSEMLTLSDRVVVPVDYNQLVNKGCYGVNEIKLMGLVLFTTYMHMRKIPKVNFVIYNFRPISDIKLFNKYQDEYIERQKNEINEVFTGFFSSFALSVRNDGTGNLYKTNDIDIKCEYVDKYSNINILLKQFYKEDAKLYQKCYVELENEFNNKLLVCDNMSKLEKDVRQLKQNRFNYNEYNQVAQNSDVYGNLLEAYQTSLASFHDGINSFINDKNKENLKPTVDKLVIDVLNSYDKVVNDIGKGEANEFRDRMGKVLKERLVDSMKTFLYVFNKDVLVQLMAVLIKQHEDDVMKINDEDKLDEKLTELISTYDSKFMKEAKKCKYSLLEKYDLYESMTQDLRLKLVSNLKEYSNRIVETMIKNGRYYHKFSIFDGIRFIPNKTLVNIMQKIFSKISIPMKIRISYFSPNAFGLSNLFRSSDPRKGDTYIYYTGKNNEK